MYVPILRIKKFAHSLIIPLPATLETIGLTIFGFTALTNSLISEYELWSLYSKT